MCEYPCTCVKPERYFVFTCCSANPKLSISTKKKTRQILILIIVLELMPASRLLNKIRVKYLFYACVCVACENGRPSSLPARVALLGPGAKKDGCFRSFCVASENQA